MFLSSRIIPQTNCKFYLKSNFIRNIHVKETENVTGKKTEIYFNGNPLNCDCHAYVIHSGVNSSDVLQHVEFIDGLICKYPLKNQEKELHELTSSDFTCDIAEYCPVNCHCLYRTFDQILTVNCNDQYYKNLPSESPSNTSILYINMKNLNSLKYLNESLWENLIELHAENNTIISEKFYIPKNLNLLNLRGNNLSMLPNSIIKHAESKNDFKIMLSSNSWKCDCSILSFKSWLTQHLSQVIDINDIRCAFSNKSMSTLSLTFMDDFELCPPIYLIAYFTGISLSLLLASALIFYYKFKLHILSFLYTYCNYFYMLICCDRCVNEDKMFDCFIAYNAGDRDITLAILAELEQNHPYYSFCIHERNWMPGRYITNNIILSVQNSRKTLIILSQEFLKSEWFYLEFQAAYRQTLQDKMDRLIIVLRGNLPDMNNLDEDDES